MSANYACNFTLEKSKEVTIYLRENTTWINKAPVNNSGHLYQAHLLPN